MKLSATDYIRDEHKKLIGLFRQFEAITRRAGEMRTGVINEIFLEMAVHNRLCNELFYPFLRARVNQTIAISISQSAEAHLRANRIIQRVKKIGGNHDLFNQLFGDFIDEVTIHIEDEEAVILPAAEKLNREELENLGEQMLLYRNEIYSAPQFADARSEIVQNPHGGEQKRKPAA